MSEDLTVTVRIPTQKFTPKTQEDIARQRQILADIDRERKELNDQQRAFRARRAELRLKRYYAKAALAKKGTITRTFRIVTFSPTDDPKAPILKLIDGRPPRGRNEEDIIAKAWEQVRL